MVFAQLLLVYWRKRHYRTYQQVAIFSSIAAILVFNHNYTGYPHWPVGNTVSFCNVDALLQVTYCSHPLDYWVVTDESIFLLDCNALT